MLAPILAAGTPKPEFIGFNTWYSASRIAPLALAEGVQAALSFSTNFSDPLAEMLFSNFYRYWRVGGWDVLASFIEAWKSLSTHSGKLTGTGVVLWSRSSLVTQAAAPPVAGRRRPLAGRARQEAREQSRKDLARQPSGSDTRTSPRNSRCMTSFRST